MNDKPNSKAAIWIPVVLAAVSLGCQIFGSWLPSRKDNPHIDIIIREVERIGKTSVDGKLTTSCEYDGQVIGEARKIKLRLHHAHGRTLIGRGDLKNISGNSIPIVLDKRYRLLECVIVDDEQAPNVTGATVARLSDTEVDLGFSQWRKDEVINLVLTVEAKEEGNFTAESLTSPRVIPDGDIQYWTRRDYDKENMHIILKALNFALTALDSGTVKMIYYVTMFVLLTLGMWATYRLDLAHRKWNLAYRNRAFEYLRKRVPREILGALDRNAFSITSKSFYDIIARRPAKVFWNDFDGPAPDSITWLDRQELTHRKTFLNVPMVTGAICWLYLLITFIILWFF